MYLCTAVLAAQRLYSNPDIRLRSIKGGLLVTETFAMMTLGVVLAVGGWWYSPSIGYSSQLFFLPGLSGSSFATTLLATMVWFNARTALFRQNIKGFSFIQLHKRKMIAVVAASVAVDIIGGVLLVRQVPVRVSHDRR